MKTLTLLLGLIAGSFAIGVASAEMEAERALLQATPGADPRLYPSRVYKSRMMCEGGGHGVAKIDTFTIMSGDFGERFFEVAVNLSGLPNVGFATGCEVALRCQGETIEFDCAGDVTAGGIAFKSGAVFIGELPMLACHRPLVRVTVSDAPGEFRVCTPGFFQ